ncbi:hypothetical protein [Ornithinimicrobium sp. W1665]|uniref:hypothetical protein n=1 Tax=Ornithinimicrobium sp. W1665 TaxID=3416666 RepID=UPI003D6A5A69
MLLDGQPARACLMFAVTAQGSEITTVEGLGGPGGELGPVQQAFVECHTACSAASARQGSSRRSPPTSTRTPTPRPRRRERRSRATCAAARGTRTS